MKPPLGSGERFASLKAKIAAKGNVRNPGAVVASIGRKKYGAKKMGQLSAMGRKHSSSGQSVGYSPMNRFGNVSS